ncbi:MAG TPA: DUF3347 domain-containing protein [Chitinophagaceae bacterium]|nr:DUF3347 domain-containing protein [Chitinophagaceae bacterium]
MKTLIISAIIIGSLTFSAKAGYNNSACNVTTITDTTPQSALSLLLTLYYDIKNSLVNGNQNLASAKADDLTKAIASGDMKNLPDADMKAFMSLKDKLAEDSKLIANAKNISQQRESFASFSANMITLAKRVKLSGQPVYEAYCPMKKAYWLSADKAIKNPYFGNAMLTCGSVKKVIQ